MPDKTTTPPFRDPREVSTSIPPNSPLLAIGIHGSMANSGGEEPGEEWRNWAEIPRDVLSVVFEKLGAFEVLFPAQWVCRAWNRFSHEPVLWRRVDMRYHSNMFNVAPMNRIAKEAVGRSNGLLEEFDGEHCGDDELMCHIADSTNQLRCLRLISCDKISDDGLVEVANRSPLLEELEITLCSFSSNVYEFVGQSCSKLKCFKLNEQWYDWMSEETEFDKEAIAIANTMHELCHLQLVGNQLTVAGLSAILDNCPHLEFLDIRHCFNVNVIVHGDVDLQKKLSKIKRVRLPTDSMHDYEFIASADGYDDDDDDLFFSGMSEIELMYDDMDFDSENYDIEEDLTFFL